VFLDVHLSAHFQRTYVCDTFILRLSQLQNTCVVNTQTYVLRSLERIILVGIVHEHPNVPRIRYYLRLKNTYDYNYDMYHSVYILTVVKLSPN